MPPRALRQRVHDRPEVVHRAMEPRIPPYGLPKPPDRRQESTLAHPRISLQRRHLLEREPPVVQRLRALRPRRVALHRGSVLLARLSPHRPRLHRVARVPLEPRAVAQRDAPVVQRGDGVSAEVASLGVLGARVDQYRVPAVRVHPALLRALRLLLQHQRPGVVRVEVGRVRARRVRVPLGSQIEELVVARSTSPAGGDVGAQPGLDLDAADEGRRR